MVHVNEFMSQLTENTLYFPPSFCSKHYQNQNCSSITIWQNKISCSFHKCSSDFSSLNSGNYLHNSFSKYSCSLDSTFTVPLNCVTFCPFNNITSPYQGHTIGMHSLVIHFTWLFLSYLLWEQFSSPEHHGMILEGKKEVKFLLFLLFSNKFE